VPDKEKCEAFLRAQKNVAEQNPTKGVPALSARPTGVLCSPNCPIRAICVYRLLCALKTTYEATRYGRRVGNKISNSF